MEPMSLEELQNIVSVCLDEIVKLKTENSELKQQIQELNNRSQENLFIATQLNKRCDETISLLNSSIDNVYYEIADERKEIFPIPQFYDISYTLEEMIINHKSIARYGDAEFSIMLGTSRQKYQEYSPVLQQRLIEVFYSQLDNLMIGVADNYGSLDQYTDTSKQEIRSYMTSDIRKYHNMILKNNRTFHNAYISRPYVIYKDNRTDAPKDRFDQLKKIWDGRDVIMIEGTLTRLGVGNDLFDNVEKRVRIEAPAINAFSKYDAILEAAKEEALKHSDKDNVLFIIALGATACVLAHDLSVMGYQALDLGHIDLEYEWFLKGEGHRCVVSNKYNNECVGGDQVEDVTDQKYFDEIVVKIE